MFRLYGPGVDKDIPRRDQECGCLDCSKGNMGPVRVYFRKMEPIGCKKQWCSASSL